MYKIIFLNSMIIGTMVAISSYSWFSMWMGLEINLLSIIPIFMSNKNMLSTESSMKYFITQAMASLILLMAVILMLLTKEFMHPLMNFQFSMMLNSALLTKLGAAPFHFWFPEVIEGLSWFNSLLLLTWQKIAPLVLIMNNQMSEKFLIMIIMCSLLISTIMGFNQISLRKILAFSSINHIAWMLTSTLISSTAWLIYFLIYSIININIINVLNQTKTHYINQINEIFKKNKTLKILFMTNFLSLGGLPPFIGFMPKWIVINWATNSELVLLTFTLIVTTLIMLFIYIRITFTSMVINTSESKNNMKFPLKNQNLLTFTNMVTFVSLILCTISFNLT